MNAANEVLRTVQEGLAEASADLVNFLPIEDLEWFVLAHIPEYQAFGLDAERDFSKSPIVPSRSLEGPLDWSDKKVTPKRPPPWFIGLASGFIKDIQNVDRKLQGRILEAITALTKDPMTPHGNTIRSLSGQFAGCWRYRIGDHRLIYAPDKQAGNLTLLAFGPRGSVYGD